jgi:hypothetical protein
VGTLLIEMVTLVLATHVLGHLNLIFTSIQGEGTSIGPARESNRFKHVGNLESGDIQPL